MTWHPTLDDIERRAEPHQPGWQKRMPQETLRVLGSCLCWCGRDRSFHDWPGKAEGRPHPR